MRRKGVSSAVAAVMIVAVAVAYVAILNYWMVQITDHHVQPELNISDDYHWDWEPTDVFNGTDNGYRGCMFKYNTTVFIDCSGNGWLLYENSTHAFVQQIATFDGWTILKKRGENR